MTKTSAVAPVVIIDSREQRPLGIEAYPTIDQGLPVGDYGILGFSDWNNPAFIVERKSLDDLVGSLTEGRERFLKEIEKMRQFRFRAVLIEGTVDQVGLGQYVSQATPQSILASLDAIAVRANVHLFWCGDASGAARQLERLVRQFCRGVEKDYRRLQSAGAELEQVVGDEQ